MKSGVMFPAADAAETCGLGTRRPCAVTGGSFGSGASSSEAERKWGL